MQPKRNCAPLDEIGITVRKMVPGTGTTLLYLALVLAILAGAVLFFMLLG